MLVLTVNRRKYLHTLMCQSAADRLVPEGREGSLPQIQDSIAQGRRRAVYEDGELALKHIKLSSAEPCPRLNDVRASCELVTSELSSNTRESAAPAGLQ